MITHPLALLAALAGIVAGLQIVSDRPPCRAVLRILPVPFWCYVLPMLATAAGIFPVSTPIYGWLSTQLLPLCLVLLLLGTDLRLLARLGPSAAAAMSAGAIGILLGAQVSLLLLHRWLPATAWMGFGALSATWIGGSANMLAIVESLNVPQELFAPLVVVDACLAYSWMGLLIASVSLQPRWDRWAGADLNALSDRVETSSGSPKRIERGGGMRIAGALTVAIVLSLGSRWASRYLPTAASLLTPSAWMVLLVTTATLLLSLTPASRLASAATYRIGTWLLLLLLTSLGARASLAAVSTAPVWLGAGLIMMASHAVILLAVGRLLRLPLGLIATASQANVGGPVSAPLVAAVFHPRLPPLALVMALAGNILGTYLGLLSAHLCRLAHTILTHP
jgi:uncharacterized membrane protein